MLKFCSTFILSSLNEKEFNVIFICKIINFMLFDFCDFAKINQKIFELIFF